MFKRNSPQRKLGSADLCVNCGKPYTVASGLQKYCPDCAPRCVAEIDRRQGLDYYRQNKSDINPKRNIKRQKPKAEIVCEICGKTFLGFKNQKFCSEDCKKENRKIYSRDYERNHPDRKKEKNDR